MAQLKRADPRYLGRNGFENEARQYIREDMPEKEAIASQDLARFVMREMVNWERSPACYTRDGIALANL